MFTKFDLYGYKADLYVNTQRTVKSKLGAFISVSLIILSLYLFTVNMNAWIGLQNTQTILSSKSLNANDLIHYNLSYLYVFDYTNYDLYFSLTAEFPNSTVLNYQQLERYFVQNFYYTTAKGLKTDLEFENCLIRDQRAFLLQDIDDLVNDINRTSHWTVCLKKPLEMGLVTYYAENLISQPKISYKITKCQNSTANNNSCASDDEIKSILPYIIVQASIPRSTYDFTNTQSPRKRTYDYQYYHLDLNLKKTFFVQVAPIFLKTDHGMFITEDYILESVDFNILNTQYESMARKDSDDVLQFDLVVGLDQTVYYRKNQKFYVFIANFGGIINILFILGKIICSFYNYLVFIHKVINISFLNLDDYDKEQESNFILIIFITNN